MIKKNNIIFKHIATLGPIGYLPASGTLATAVMLPVVWYLRNHIIGWGYNIISLLLFFIGSYIITQALKFFDEKDPSAVVFDEISSFLLVFLVPFGEYERYNPHLYRVVPLDITHLLLGFILFRLFDIYKPFGIKSLEQLDDAYGVIYDDFAAAFLAGIILNIIVYMVPCIFK